MRKLLLKALFRCTMYDGLQRSSDSLAKREKRTDLTTKRTLAIEKLIEKEKEISLYEKANAAKNAYYNDVKGNCYNMRDSRYVRQS
jgi:hypothetical protein